MKNALRSASLVVAAVVVTLVVQAAIASPSTTKSGKGITQVKVVRETADNTTTSTSPTDLPGATTTITVAAGTKALILARFSAESQCDGGVGGWCIVEILIGGVPADPNDGDNFAFDTDSTDLWESNSMDRSRGPLGPGTYTVQVRYWVLNAGMSFRLDDWSLIVERVAK